ncbi:MAG: hypothetical protein HUU46_15375 [Candidatus Hydrogenedentes bacterium]|nr:hypothetical protein [Candidatus Hydrogenedentota bacterium]
MRVIFRVAVCAAFMVSASHAAGGVTVLPLRGEALPRLVAAFDASLALAQPVDGRTFVRVRVSDADATALLGQIRFADGDELVRIDGEPIHTVAAAHAIVRGKRPGDDVTFVVKSNGFQRIIALEILPVSSAPQPSPPVQSPRPQQLPVQRAVAPKSGVVEIDESALQRELEKYDPFELFVAAELEMARDDAGAVIGIRSPRFGDIAVSRMVGLRNDDIVMSVNGMPVSSELAVFEIADRLQGEKSFAAQVLRAGKPITLRVRIQ